MDSGTLIDEDELYWMTNLRPKTTGLPFTVFVSMKGRARHDVRVKVSRSAKPEWVASVAVRPTVEIVDGDMSSTDFVQLARWIELNRDAIVGHWDGEIEYAEDLLEALKPLPAAE
jgi:hypothetical protein